MSGMVPVETDNKGSVYVPTLREQLWRALGFNFHLGDTGDVLDDRPSTGWMRTNVRFKFHFWDRVRLLVTGRLNVTISTDMDTPSPDKIFNRVDWHILPPGQQH